MITDIDLDLPLKECSCGDPKNLSFWFKGHDEKTVWKVRHTSKFYCRKETPYYKTKKEAQKHWNKND